jgi:hypothetical protein
MLIKSYAALGILVLAMAIVLEVVSAFSVIGIGLAGYHLAGFTIDISTLYTDVVAIIVLLSFGVMSYGGLKIKQTAQHV